MESYSYSHSAPWNDNPDTFYETCDFKFEEGRDEQMIGQTEREGTDGTE